VVIAYTGEVVRRAFGASSFSVNFGCGALQGFRNSSGSNFVLNGHYSGGVTPNYLFYDGHPGYDYRTTDQNPTGRVDVLAAAAGTVVCVSLRTVDGADMNREENAGACTEGRTQGEIKIDHGNGYFTVYLHLSSADVHANNTVVGGQRIGLSGETGAQGSSHLHFEVRKNIGGILVPVDPYGWQGSGPDPYTRATNVHLWLSGSLCHLCEFGDTIPAGFGVPWNVLNPLDYRGRDAGHPAPPAQIRTCGATAYGSYLGCMASKRTLGNGCRMRWVGIQRRRRRPNRRQFMRVF
jgi:murein DD-endopeptidase MepM/ murein hydrolase activator NlpD